MKLRASTSTSISILPYADFSYILGYLDGEAETEEDFDKNNGTIVLGSFTVPATGHGLFTSTACRDGAPAPVDANSDNHDCACPVIQDNCDLDAVTAELDRRRQNLAFDDEWWLREGGRAGRPRYLQ